MTCAKCFHDKEYHGVVCSGSLECFCQKYEEPFLHDFALRVEEEKQIRKTIYERCKYILEKIPPTRNAGEKAFAKIYNEIWYGFKIRKDGTQMTTEVWKRLPNQDTINREKRRVKHDFPEFRTYDKDVLLEQTAIYQALLEMAVQ